MRIGVVNDLQSATHVLRRTVEAGGHQVAWSAADGAEAVACCCRDRPDVVLMDLIMPVMDGVEATRRIMAEAPCPILVVTATVTGNASRVYEALGAGALDAVDTPSMAPDGSLLGADRMLRRIDQIRRLSSEPPAPTRRVAAVPAAPRTTLPPVLAIGASTGGPQALAVVLRGLPRPLSMVVLVVQHIGAPFVAGLAEWLSRETGHAVEVGGDGAAIEAGRVLVGGGERHLTVDCEGRVRCPAEPSTLLHRPSVDVLFESLATSPCRGVAALLTGMGRDGATGLLALRGRGWWTIAQDRATSVVWGMPGAAVRAGAACEELALDAIAASASRHMRPIAGGAG